MLMMILSCEAKLFSWSAQYFNCQLAGLSIIMLTTRASLWTFSSVMSQGGLYILGWPNTKKADFKYIRFWYKLFCLCVANIQCEITAI